MADVSVNTRRLTEKGAAQAKKTFSMAAAASKDETRQAEQSALTAVNGVRECYLRMREAFGTFSEQTKELTELAQKAATSTVQPLTNGLTSPFRQAQ